MAVLPDGGLPRLRWPNFCILTTASSSRGFRSPSVFRSLPASHTARSSSFAVFSNIPSDCAHPSVSVDPSGVSSCLVDQQFRSVHFSSPPHLHFSIAGFPLSCGSSWVPRWGSDLRVVGGFFPGQSSSGAQFSPLAFCSYCRCCARFPVDPFQPCPAPFLLVAESRW